MTPEELLAEKLPAYRSLLERACAGLFDGEQALTVELDDDDADSHGGSKASNADSKSSNHGSKTSNDGSKTSNAGSKSSNDGSKTSNGGSKTADNSSATAGDAVAAVKAELLRAIHEIAGDFAKEFNRKLSAAANDDPSVALVASKYEMTEAHVDELATVLAAAAQPLVKALDGGDLDGARRASLQTWPAFERRVRSKWQAYFVFTFQDVSVERKAARDRRKLQQRFDPHSAPHAVEPNAKLRAMPDLAPFDERPRAMSPWIAVIALLILAAAGGWLLVRHGHAAAAVGGAASTH